MRTKRSVVGYDLDMVLRELYESIYEISDLDNPDNPLAIIEMSNKEGLWELGPRARLMREFYLYKINSIYCSWNEFLSLPKYQTTFMIDMLREEEIRVSNNAKREKAALDKGGIPDL